MPEINKIVYVAYQPLTEKFKQDFYLDLAKDKGFEIEYWNLSAIYHRSNPVYYNDGLNKNIIKNFFSLKHVEREVIRIQQTTLFIFNINYYGSVYSLFRIFSKYKCITAFFARGALSFPLQNQSLSKKIFVKFKALKSFGYSKTVLLNMLAAQARKRNLIAPFTYVFFAGSESLPVIGYGYQYGLSTSKLIPVNSFDFDKYIQLKSTHERLVEEEYCVFLDTFLPYHPDFDLLKLPKVNADNYYTALNDFFDKVEEVHNMKVVIAAHPKSSYLDTNVFKNRIVIKFKTGELIKDAAFVISQASTSISFAILFKKPILFTYTNEMKKIYGQIQFPLILHFAKILKCSCVNIDNIDTTDVKLMPVNTNAYDDYMYKYLTNKESESQLSEEIFTYFLKQLN